ncbi:hypothetical protein Cadr_000028594 [Camelus dromedarius]|uniref:Uncharacterized protein n=1 Tax=Camelus dromedarius TaxID=9838 RepID=A0A5N4CI75_CAMDR|nr:hypothetical protein Cadr_000028594 [Camelus dromedarius]
MWSVLPSRMGLTDPHEGEGPEVKGLRPGGRSQGHTAVWTEVSLTAKSLGRTRHFFQDSEDAQVACSGWDESLRSGPPWASGARILVQGLGRNERGERTAPENEPKGNWVRKRPEHTENVLWGEERTSLQLAVVEQEQSPRKHSGNTWVCVGVSCDSRGPACFHTAVPPDCTVPEICGPARACLLQVPDQSQRRLHGWSVPHAYPSLLTTNDDAAFASLGPKGGTTRALHMYVALFLTAAFKAPRTSLCIPVRASGRALLNCVWPVFALSSWQHFKELGCATSQLQLETEGRGRRRLNGDVTRCPSLGLTPNPKYVPVSPPPALPQQTERRPSPALPLLRSVQGAEGGKVPLGVLADDLTSSVVLCTRDVLYEWSFEGGRYVGAAEALTPSGHFPEGGGSTWQSKSSAPNVPVFGSEPFWRVWGVGRGLSGVQDNQGSLRGIPGPTPRLMQACVGGRFLEDGSKHRWRLLLAPRGCCVYCTCVHSLKIKWKRPFVGRCYDPRLVGRDKQGKTGVRSDVMWGGCQGSQGAMEDAKAGGPRAGVRGGKELIAYPAGPGEKGKERRDWGLDPSGAGVADCPSSALSMPSDGVWVAEGCVAQKLAESDGSSLLALAALMMIFLFPVGPRTCHLNSGDVWQLAPLRDQALLV